MRGLSPFPRTINSPRSRFILSRVRLQSSETRSPVENKVSNNAMSRRSCSLFVFGTASNNLSISSISKKSTVLCGVFPSSIFSADKVLISCLAKNLRKALSAII